MNQQADPDDFQALLREHEAILFKVARLYASHAEDRRDLVQEIRLQAWRSFLHFDPHKARFTTWLYRIALNVAVSALRKRTSGLEHKLEPLGEEHLDGMSAEPPSEHDERIDILYKFIGQLDGLNRGLILLYLEDKTTAEMAEIVGISQTNVSTKINRIKRLLREQMTGACAQEK